MISSLVAHAVAEGGAEPAQGGPGAGGDHLVQVAAGRDVRHQADHAGGVEHRLGGDHAPAHRRSGADAEVAGIHDAGPERRGGVIASAGDEDGAGKQPNVAGGVAEDAAGLPRTVPDVREDLPRDAGRLAGLGAPVLRPPVVEDTAGGAGRIGADVPGQPVGQVVLGLQGMPDPPPHVRLVAFGPGQVRQHQPGDRQRATAVDQPVPAQAVVQLPRLIRVPAVGPVDARGQDRPVGVQQDRDIPLPHQAQGADFRGWHPGPGQHLGDDGGEGHVPVLRVVLGPVTLGAVHRVGVLGDGRHA